VCAQAQAAEQALDASARNLAADFECAQIALDRGEVDAAARVLQSIEAKSSAVADTFFEANAELLLGQIAMGRRQWSAGRDALQKSLAGWTAAKELAGEATASAFLALCAQGLSDTKARDQEAARARELRSAVTQRAEVFELDVALAELQGVSGPPEQAQEALRALARDAEQRHWPGLALEARLAALRVAEQGADSGSIASSINSLKADAHHAGYEWVAVRAY
jgi:thioredoxin-like negative regulator of GroEL